MVSGLMARMRAFVVVAFGLALGGPQRLPVANGTEVVGADPADEDCNGNGIESQVCPKNSGDPAYTCSTGNYHIIKDELPGTSWGDRYNNIVMVCAVNALNPCKRYTLKKVDPKKCKDKLSTGVTITNPPAEEP